MSVPNQKSADGGFKRLIGATACGSMVPSHGAKIAMATMQIRITPPMSAVGWRLKASRKRRQVGDTDLGAAVDGATRVVALISITYARIEKNVRQVDQEIDQHVDRGKNENHALNDGIVAAQDRVDRQPPDSRQREYGFGHDRAADQQRDTHADDSHDGDRRVLERVAD